MKVTPLILAVLVGGTLVNRRSRLSAALQAAGALACAGLLAAGTGVVDPPPVEEMVRSATTTLGVYAYPLVGLGAFLETGAGVGLIMPGDLVVILGGVSAGQREIDIAGLIAIVWLCALAGDLTSYLLGRRLGRVFLLRHGPAVGITVARLERAEKFLAAHGGKTIIIGRFIGVVRALAPFVAGASRMPARRFVPYTTLAAGLWASTFCLLGYAFWQSLDQLLAITRQGSVAVAVIAVLALGGFLLIRRLRARAGRGGARSRPGAAEPDASW